MAQIEIIGDDNYVLINDEFMNMIFVEKKTVYFPPVGGTYSGAVATVSYTSSDSEFPLIAINSSFLCSQTRCTKSGNTWTWGLACNSAGVGGTAEVYILHLPKSVPNAGGLVQLFNAQGVLVFDSNLRYMKMEKQLFMTMDNPTSTPVTPGRKYAAIHSKLPAFYSLLQGSMSCGPNFRAVIEQSQLNGTITSNGSVYSSSYILWSREYCAQPPFPSGSYRTKDGLCMIVDVTGY